MLHNGVKVLLGGNVSDLPRNIAGAQFPMDRRAEDADYVLENLCRARQEVTTHPEWFDPDAVERIDKAIAAIQEARCGVKAA